MFAPNASLRLPQPPSDSQPRGLLVTTRYLGPTDMRDSRISATCRRDSDTTFRAVVAYDYSTDVLGAHYAAALACLRKIESQNAYYAFTFQAVAPTEHGYAFVTHASDIAPTA